MSRGLYQPIMEIDVDPLYIKHDDINNIRDNRHIKLCTPVNKLYPGEILGHKNEQYLVAIPRNQQNKGILNC